MLKWVDVSAAVLAALAAMASAYAAVTLTNIEEKQRFFEEKLTAINVLAEWSKGHSEAGHHCVSFMARYNPSSFVDMANTRSFLIKDNQKNILSSCFHAFVGNVDEDNDGKLNDTERMYVARQVSIELNNYEALSMYWEELGAESKNIICTQAKIEPRSAYREFRKVAIDTPWWNYPMLEKFMDSCND